MIHNSPADHAGIRGSYKPVIIQGDRVLIGGDILTGIDHQPLTRMNDLLEFMQQAHPGQKITLSLLRDGKTLQLAVTLDAPPSATP